jgi:hypothetical protein
MATWRRLDSLAIDVENWSGVLDVSELRRERARLVRRLARAGVSTSRTRAGHR